MPSNSRFKCYFGCANHGPLHSFPKPKFPHLEKFELWKKILSPNLQSKGNQYIYNQIRICNRHFEKYFISNSNRLTPNAMPTLFVNVVAQSSVAPSIAPKILPDTSIVPAVAMTSKSSDLLLPHQQKSVVVQSAVAQSIEPITLPDTSIVPAVAVMSKSSDLLLPNQEKSESTGKRMRGNAKKESSSIMLEKLRKKIKTMKLMCKNEKAKVLLAKKMAKNATFLKTIDKLPNPIKLFTIMQMKFKKKPKGRRFSVEEKIMALTIFKQSQKSYRLLRKLFILPSKRSLQQLLSCFNIQAGINPTIMENLKKNVEKLPEEKRLCTLLFDEVALSASLQYDLKKQEIIGFEDNGSQKSKLIADHALVFMIKGIKSKKKQPICFTFCKGATKKIDLKNILINVIKKISETGIKIIATVCDQATTNAATIKSLKEDTRIKYVKENKEYQSTAFEIENLKIFHLFDPPHLLKGVRNNFMKKNIKYLQNGKEKTAKWEHLKMLLEVDKGEDEIRLVNKLTEKHLFSEKMNKMKVKFAAQVFSQRVSSAMRFLAKHNILPSESEETADLLLIFDKLFDSFNGHSYQDSAKVLKGCVKNNSPHFKFWQEIIPVLESMVFLTIKKQPNGNEIVTSEKIPSLQNWISNIKTFIEMFEYLKKTHNVKNVVTRNYNQDPLENFFSCIRSNGIRNVNPTCIQFISAYKTLIINNFDSPHSISANCENDNNQSMQSLKFLLTDQKSLISRPEFTCNIDSLLITMDEMKSRDISELIHMESKKYVAGYVIKKCKSKICKNCIACSKNLLTPDKNVDSFTYEIDYTKKSLNYACDTFINLLNEIYYMIITCLRESPEVPFLKEKILFFIKCNCDFDSVITCNRHKADLIEFIINLSIKLIIHSWCTGINRILNGKIKQFDQNDLCKLQAFNYYEKHCKKK